MRRRFVNAYIRYRGNFTIFTLKTEAVKAYETSLTLYQSKWFSIPEDVTLNSHRKYNKMLQCIKNVISYLYEA